MRIPFAIPLRGGRTCDVVGLGLNSIDLVGVVAEYPLRNTKQPLQTLARLPGGQIATATSACARLGWRARYIGRFGDDDLGALGRSSLTSVGVDISAAQTVNGATSQAAIVLVDARSGERTILWHRHPLLAMEASDVPREAVTSGRLLIVDCHDTAAAAEAARVAREAGIPTIVDVERVRPGIADLLRQIDAIIAAEDFPSAFTGYDQPGRALKALAREFDAPLACVTLGERGSLAYCRDREFHSPAFPVECVDSTGAGDAFRGGFAAGCLNAPEGDLEDALRYANAVAALNCRAIGARGGLPTREEVADLLGAG